MDIVKKQYKYLFRKVIDEDVIRKAYKNMRKEKTSRCEIRWIDANLDECVKKMRTMLINTMPDAKHSEYAFNPPKHETRVVHEYDKPRHIIEPSVIEQWVHHIIILVLKPIFMRRFHEHSYGSIPNRGIHTGKKLLKKWKHLGYKYLLKIDVRHYYASVQYSILIRKLETFIKDDLLINLIKICFKHHTKGLPLGFYLSQWLGNAFLEDVDIALSRKNEYIRYMDDIAIPSNDKKELHRLVSIAKEKLSKLRLKLKGNYQIISLKHRNIDFLGFIFRNNQVRLRKRLIKRIKQCVRRIRRCIADKRKIHIRWVKQLLAYKGWIDHSNSQSFYLKHIQPVVTFKKAEKIVSLYDRRKSKNVNSLEKRTVKSLSRCISA